MIKVSVIIPVFNQEQLVLKALDSIPSDPSIEIIVIDDCSTDDTFYVLRAYQAKKDFVLLSNKKNMGVGFTVNCGIDVALGEYIVLLGSDDYFYTDKFLECIKLLDGTDLVYFNLQINDGSIFKLTPETKLQYCGSTKFMRTKFIGNTRTNGNRAAEDKYLYEELLKKNPTEKFTDLIVKHYNYPRENSVSWKVRHGITTQEGNEK